MLVKRDNACCLRIWLDIKVVQDNFVFVSQHAGAVGLQCVLATVADTESACGTCRDFSFSTIEAFPVVRLQIREHAQIGCAVFSSDHFIRIILVFVEPTRMIFSMCLSRMNDNCHAVAFLCKSGFVSKRYSIFKEFPLSTFLVLDKASLLPSGGLKIRRYGDSSDSGVIFALDNYTVLALTKASWTHAHSAVAWCLMVMLRNVIEVLEASVKEFDPISMSDRELAKEFFTEFFVRGYIYLAENPIVKILRLLREFLLILEVWGIPQSSILPPFRSLGLGSLLLSLSITFALAFLALPLLLGERV